jgi:hypothetical protein
MKFIVDLPSDILVLICKGWIPITTLTLVDTAFCNKIQRKQFASIVKICNSTGGEFCLSLRILVPILKMDVVRFVVILDKKKENDLRGQFERLQALQLLVGQNRMACICKESLIEDFLSPVIIKNTVNQYVKSFLFWENVFCLQKFIDSAIDREGFYIGQCILQDSMILRHGVGLLVTNLCVYHCTQLDNGDVLKVYLGGRIHPNHHSYTGQFKFNLMDGGGICVHANGTSYNGFWFENKLNGDCTFTDKDGITKQRRFEVGIELLY